MRLYPRLHSYKARRRIRSSARLEQGGYGWELPKENPYRVKPAIIGRLKVKLWLALSAAATFIGILIYHPFFYIQKIVVTGQERLTESDIIQAVEGIINTRHFWIFPGRSYLIADIDEVKDILQDKFPLQSIVVQKTFPQELRITLEEKLSTIIYDNGKQYSYLGLDGKVVEIAANVALSEWRTPPSVSSSAPTLAPTSTAPRLKSIHVPDERSLTAELGNYPIVYDTRGSDIEVNQRALEPDTVRGIIDWFQFLTKQTNIPVGYFSIADDGGVGEVITGEGWGLLIRLTEQHEEQMESLRFVLKEKITDRRALKLVDLRFPGRVYWE